MRKELELLLSDNHIERQINAKNALDGLKEGVWNSLDADSNNVYIKINTIDDAGSTIISSVEISDDGHGIKYDEVENSFKNLGISSKNNNPYSPKGRNYHGKLGEGRYLYIAIGRDIVIHSVYKKGVNNYAFDINISESNLRKITISEEKLTEEKSGVIVKIYNVVEKANKYLLDKKLSDNLMNEFASYLLKYKEIKIYVDNEFLDVNKNIEYEKNYEYKKEVSADIKIIKWKSSKYKERYFCGEDGVALLTIPLKVNLECSIYMCSSYFSKLRTKGTLESYEFDAIAKDIIDFSNSCYSEFLKEIDDELSNEILKDINEVKIFPEFPTNEIEKEQKALYEKIALEVTKCSNTVKKSNKDYKKIIYNMIGTAVKDNPESLMTILKEVFNLPKEKQDEFAEILEETSLVNVINTVKEVSDRLVFLKELHSIVYGDLGKKMKERTEFQKILLQELWVFGDKYKYGVDDVSLRNVLKAHLKELDREDFISEIDISDTQLNKIPDICLWNKQRIGDKYENLVVEIKKPIKVLGEKEVSQIQHYAFAIKDEPGFDKTITKWHFILIGNNFDSYVENLLNGKENGIIWQGDNCDIQVLKWSKLIDENELRYEFFKENMEMEIKEKQITKSISDRLDKIKSKK